MPRTTKVLNAAVRALTQLGAPVLHSVAKPVPESMFKTPELQKIVTDMIDTMKDANGAGIAAPQIGEPWRIFVVHGTGENPRYPYKPAIPLTVFINPVIEVLDESPMHIIEGCLSIPGMRGRVTRNARVRCTAQKEDGSTFSVLAEGHAAGTLQHEQDHLEGQLFPDITHTGWLMTWESFEMYQKTEFFEYADELNSRYPQPVTFEDNGVASSVTRGERTKTYSAELTWTGKTFEKNIFITIGEDGKIMSVKPKDGHAKGDNIVHLPNRAIIPGFVNAHSHAFQRGLRGKGETYPRGPEGDPTPSFWTWREAMYELVNGLSDVDKFKEQTKQCFEEMAAAGITTCGEFHYFHHSSSGGEDEDFTMDQAVIEAAREANVRLVLLNACYERGGFDNSPLGQGQQHFRTLSQEKYWDQMGRLNDTLLDSSRGEKLGVVVHSLRAAGVESLQRLAAEAYSRKMPLHIHLEEQPQEISDCIETHGITPLGLLLESVPPEHLQGLSAVHCTHSREDELTKLISTGAGVCICPLTEASLGDGIFLSLEPTEGEVSIGTDCNARIDMFEEMRWLEYTQRLKRGQRGVFASVVPDRKGTLSKYLFDCATVVGARHLQVDTGTIEKGKWADFALLDLKASSLRGAPVDEVMGSCIFGGSAEGLIVNSCVGGRWTKALH